MLIFSTLFLCISYGSDKENLFDFEELPKLVIISCIVMTFTFDLMVTM